MATCETCTFKATLAAATELVNEAENHQTRYASLGGIALTEKSLEAVSNHIDCDKPTVNAVTGQLDCPIREQAMMARGLAFAGWPQATYMVELQSVANETRVETQNTGQYL